MRPSLSRLRALMAAKARRDGKDSRPQPLSAEGANAIRRELGAGKAGPYFGDGPAKREWMTAIIRRTKLPADHAGRFRAEVREYRERTGEGADLPLPGRA